MKRNEYLNLAKSCDTLLLAPDSTPERIAIAWLHLVREHPTFLQHYADLFEPAGDIGPRFSRLVRTFAFLVGYWRQCIRWLASREIPWFATKLDHAPTDVLFLSHLLSSSHQDQQDDFYFGHVPADLARTGISTGIALINHTKIHPRQLSLRFVSTAIPRFILSNSLSIADEFNLRQRVVSEKQKLRTLITELPLGLEKQVAARAVIESMSGATLGNLRIGYQVAMLVQKLQPKALVVTHEGHAYERIAFYAARSVLPKITCIGYQHAAIFQDQHAIRRKLAPKYNPDYVLTAGVVAQSQLLGSNTLGAIPISVLGSTRIAKTPANSNIKSAATRDPTNVERFGCVVLPEGIESECQLLFAFSLECALALPNINFFWRLHPLISFKTLLKRNRRLRERTPNIELSDRTLEEDIGRCHLALYRGTTAVVQAVMGGLTPIYLQMRGEMTIDPLYEIEKGKFIVRTPEEFVEMIGTPGDTIDGATEHDRAELVDYCSRFYVPMDFRVLEKIIRGAPERAPTNTTGRDPKPPSPF